MKQFLTIISIALCVNAYAQKFTDSINRDDRWYYCMQPKDIYPKYFYPQEDYTPAAIRYFEKAYHTEDTSFTINMVQWWPGHSTDTAMLMDLSPTFPIEDYTDNRPLQTHSEPMRIRTFKVSWRYEMVGKMKTGHKTIESTYYPTMKTISKYLPKPSINLGSLYFSMEEQ